MAANEPRPVEEMSIEDVKEELERLASETNDLGMKLKEQGAELDMNSLSRTRLELLVIYLLGDEESEQRMRFELRWQRVLNNQVAGILKQVNRAKLLQKGHMPKGSKGPSGGGIIRGRG